LNSRHDTRAGGMVAVLVKSRTWQIFIAQRKGGKAHWIIALSARLPAMQASIHDQNTGQET
jgi:hypothetical protein